MNQEWFVHFADAGLKEKCVTGPTERIHELLRTEVKRVAADSERCQTSNGRGGGLEPSHRTRAEEECGRVCPIDKSTREEGLK